MSGAFATRTLANTQEAITELTKTRERLRAYVVEEGNDPPEITDWTWSGRARARERRLARSVYITAIEPQSGKSVVALGLMEMLSARAERVGFFRPVVPADGSATRRSS